MQAIVKTQLIIYFCYCCCSNNTCCCYLVHQQQQINSQLCFDYRLYRVSCSHTHTHTLIHAQLGSLIIWRVCLTSMSRVHHRSYIGYTDYYLYRLETPWHGSVETSRNSAPSGHDVLRQPAWLCGMHLVLVFRTIQDIGKAAFLHIITTSFPNWTKNINLQNYYKTTTYNYQAIYFIIFHYIFCDTFLLRPKYNVRGRADKYLAKPSSRCRRTESIVSLEIGVCSCAELQVFSCCRG